MRETGREEIAAVQMEEIIDMQAIEIKEVYSCGICYNEGIEESKVSFLGCGHQFCTQCLKDYLNYMINISGAVQKIKCPDPGC